MPPEKELEVDPLEAIPTIPTHEVTWKGSPVVVEQDAPSKHFAESETESTTPSFETGDPPQKICELLLLAPHQDTKRERPASLFISDPTPSPMLTNVPQHSRLEYEYRHKPRKSTWVKFTTHRKVLPTEMQIGKEPEQQGQTASSKKGESVATAAAATVLETIDQ